MRASAIKRSLVCIGLQCGLLAIVSAQTLPTIDIQAFTNEGPKMLPKYEIEVIVFSYHDFDPAEERFEEIPRGSLLDLLNPTLLETHTRADTDVSKALSDSLRTIDDNQPMLIPTEPSDRTYSIEDLLGSPQGNNPLGQEIFSLEEMGPSATLEPYAAGTRLDDPSAAPIEELAVDALNNLEGEFTTLSGDEASNEGLLTEEQSTWYRILTAEELELTNTANRLEQLDVYTPLIHGGWVQEGQPEEDAIPFELSLLGGFNPLGTIQLHVNRFLHVTVALRYQSDRPPGELLRPVGHTLEEITFPPRYTLHIQRRTRSNQVHFFDHPAFGVLVLVRPAPEEPEIPGEGLAPAA